MLDRCDKMKARVRFGPAGIPRGSPKQDLYSGVEYTGELKLDAFECEFSRGVRINKEVALRVRKLANDSDISLSCHAPYWVNACSKEKVKIETSIRNIMEAARAAHLLGAGVIVFHPGFYMGKSSEECAVIAKKTLQVCIEKMGEEKINNVFLGPETTGKLSQYGSLQEVLELCSSLERCKPTIDFAHLHARGIKLKKKEDYKEIFDKIEKELGGSALKDLHTHFSEVEYTKKGERRHLVLGTNNEPPFRPLSEAIVENGYGATIISESPLLEIDALKMKNAYVSLLSKKGK